MINKCRILKSWYWSQLFTARNEGKHCGVESGEEKTQEGLLQSFLPHTQTQ